MVLGQLIVFAVMVALSALMALRAHRTFPPGQLPMGKTEKSVPYPRWFALGLVPTISAFCMASLIWVGVRDGGERDPRNGLVWTILSAILLLLGQALNLRDIAAKLRKQWGEVDGHKDTSDDDVNQ